MRDRLKEAKGIGTPATRAEIIKGLKRQNLLAADGKLVVPTPAGLQLFELLRGAAPALVDPGTTALWEMRLDEVLVGKADYHAVIDGVATAARELIEALVEKSIGKVELATSAPARRTGGRRGGRQADGAAAAKSAGSGPRRSGSKTQRAPKAKPTERDSDERAGRSKAPTDKMVAYAENLSRAKKAKLPDLYRQDFDACRKFLDEHAR